MLGGMYQRVTNRTNADGSVVRYVALAHNERTGGQTRARVLLNLGREDGLDTDGLRRLVSPVSRFLGDADPYAAGSGERADLLRMTSPRSMGGAWLLDGLWKQLGIDAALRRLLGPRRFSTDVERVLFALVANRALDPSSKLAASEWAERDAAIGGPGSMSDDQAYRAIDLLIEAGATAKARAVFFAVANLLNLETGVLLAGTTSTYFEAEPDVGADGEPGLAALRAFQGPPARPPPGRHRACRDQGVHPGAGLVVAREYQRHQRAPLRSATGCGTGSSAGSSRSPAAGSPRTRSRPACARAAGSRSPGSGCGTRPATPPRPCPGRAGSPSRVTTST